MRRIFVLLSLATFAFQPPTYCMEDLDIYPPNLSKWDGESVIDGWVPDQKRATAFKEAQEKPDLYLYHMWILNPQEGEKEKFCTRHEDAYPLSIVIKSLGKVSLRFHKKEHNGHPIDPAQYYFAEDPDEKGFFTIKDPYHKHGGASGKKFDAWNGKKGHKNAEGKRDLPNDLHIEANTFPKSAVFRFRKVSEELED